MKPKTAKEQFLKNWDEDDRDHPTKMEKELDEVINEALQQFKNKKQVEVVLIKKKYFLIESDEIELDSFGNQNVQLNDYVLDIKTKEVGRVSHIGGAFYFKGTLQFPLSVDLRENRHCTFNCRKIIASTSKINELFMLIINYSK